MKKSRLTKLESLFLGLSMALGVGAAISAKKASEAKAAEGDKVLTFDLSKNPGNWPTANSTTLTNYKYTLDGTDYSFGLKNVKCNSGYLMLTSTALLGLPAIENYKLTKVIASNSGGCSTAVIVGISSSASSADYIGGGAAQTWVTQGSSYTYNLSNTESNTVYYLYVTNKNAQVTSLELTYASTSTNPGTDDDDEGGAVYQIASSISAGDIVVLGCAEKGTAAGEMGSNVFLSSVEANINDGTLSSEDAIEFTVGGSSGAFTFTSSEGTIGATAEKKLSCTQGTTTWAVSFSNGNATIASTNSNYGSIQYNASSPRFLNYKSSQTAIQIYKKSGGVEPTSDPKVTINDDFLNQTIAVGATLTFTADAENTTEPIKWSSSNTSVATINEITGLATGVANGTTTVTATVTVDGIDYTDETTLNVSIPEPSIIEMSNFNDFINYTGADYTVMFHSFGVITGFGTDGNGTSQQESKGTLYVEDVNGTSLYLFACTGGEATKVSWDGVEGKYDWEYANNAKTLGLTKDLKIGDKIEFNCVRVVYKDTIEGYAKVLSSTINTLSSIDVTPIKTEYYTGDTISTNDFTVKGTYTVAGEQDISSSSCTINPNGVLLNEGDVTVTISFSGKTDTYTIHVAKLEIDITKIEITESTLTLLSTDKDYQLEYSILPANNTETVSWSSSDEDVVKVSDSGLLTYVAEGTAEVTLKGKKEVYEDSVSVTCRRGAIYGIQSSVTDELVKTTFIDSEITSYTEFENKKSTSNAVYAGIIAGNYGSIQMTNGSSRGFVTTASGGLVKSITVDWNSQTSNDRHLNIYGSNTAYTSAADLYDNSKRGTLLGTLDNGGTTTLNVTDEYKYVGFVSSKNAMYFNKITIVWDSSVNYKATINDLDALDTFMNDYLRMDSYDSTLSGEGDGSCIDFWDDVKDYFNNDLSADQRKLFLNYKVNTQYASAYARLQEWADANGDSLTEEGLLEARLSLGLLNNFEDSTWIIVVVAIAGLTAITGCLFYRKRRMHR